MILKRFKQSDDNMLFKMKYGVFRSMMKHPTETIRAQAGRPAEDSLGIPLRFLLVEFFASQGVSIADGCFSAYSVWFDVSDWVCLRPFCNPRPDNLKYHDRESEGR
jgi:hypothetical protein